MKRVVFVDLDNLYIINNRVNVPILKSRIEEIKKMKSKIYWFGNTFTSNIVQKNDIKINVIDTAIEVNSSDHKLINNIQRSQAKKIMLISSDMTLARIALYLNPDKTISFQRFTNNRLEEFHVDYKFENRKHLTKFMESLALYIKRFH